MKHKIQNLLPGDHPWQNQLHWYDTIPSTNTLAKEMILQGAPHGTVLIAGQQTGGRGRMGRSYHCPAGLGVYYSVILRYTCPAQELMHLTCAAAHAMCDAVEAASGLRPSIKWTNDLVVGNRKLGGILTELVHLPGEIAAVIGIGINCLHKPEDFPSELQATATSLAMAEHPATPEQLAAAMTVHLEQMDRMLLQEKDRILDAYRRNCITLGKQIRLEQGDQILRGEALDIDDQGALIVRFEDGQIRAVNSGEVTVRGMYGYV